MTKSEFKNRYSEYRKTLRNISAFDSEAWNAAMNSDELFRECIIWRNLRHIWPVSTKIFNYKHDIGLI